MGREAPADEVEANGVEKEELEDRKSKLAKERKESSNRYLSKREQESLYLYRQKIAEEKEFFDKSTLTQAELKRLETQEQILETAVARKRLKNDNLQTYQMPKSYVDSETGLLQSNERKRLIEKSSLSHYKQNPDTQMESENWEQRQLLRTQVQTKPPSSTKDKDMVFDQDVLERKAARVRSSSNQLKDGDQGDTVIIREAKRRLEIEKTQKTLPVFSFKKDLLAAIHDHQVLIVVAETGSGKTTQIPQYLIEAGYTKNDASKIIGCTQPRRVAAMSVAARVADEMRVPLGDQVGYSIRFEDCTSPTTILKYMTDGMLLREFLTQPDLASYGVLIIDEAHERTLHTDILFGLVKDIARYRGDSIRIIISSATLDAEKFSEYFDDAPIFTIPGRRYPVENYYTREPESDYIAAIIKSCLQIHSTSLVGDILVFLTGQEEIELVNENLLEIAKRLGDNLAPLILAPIYANLPADQQSRIFMPTPQGARKIVLATNIAETSITIDGIAFVVDCGFVKQKNFNARSGMSSLVITPISKASAQQRSGRAGRVGPGKCFRVYTRWAYEHELEENTVPEIQRTNLGNVVLLLKSLGIDDILNFDFMDAPPPHSLMKALEELYALGALATSGALSDLGWKMAEFPVDPMMSKAIIASQDYGCVSQVVSIISMLSVYNALYHIPKTKKTQAEAAIAALAQPEGDHLSLLRTWEAWEESGWSKNWCFDNFIQYKSMKRCKEIRTQLLSLAQKSGIDVESSSQCTVAIRKALLSGYFLQSSCLITPGDSYRSVKNNQRIFVHPSSPLQKNLPKWIIYHELILTTKEYMREICAIEPEWLLEVAPHYFNDKEIQNLSKFGSTEAPIRMPKICK